MLHRRIAPATLLGLGLVLCLAGGIALAMAWGADTMWDLRNYHLYNAFAFVHGRLGTDIAPIALQGYFNPLLDLPFYGLYTGPGPIAAHIYLGACYGALVWVVFLLNRRVFAHAPWTAPHPPAVRSLLLPLAATGIGVTGAAALGQAATTTNEVQVAALVLSGLLLVLPRAGREAPSPTAVLAGALLMGMAVGLKPTAIVYAVGGAAALLPWRLRAPDVRRFALFAGAGLAGAVLTYGFWGWTLYERFGNPFFPQFNQIFRSPWTAPAGFVDHRLLPQTVLEALVYPAWWAFAPARRSSELALQDPRLLLLIVLVAGFVALRAAAPVRHRPGRAFGTLLVFAAVAYVAWLGQFSILRYAIPLEVVAGTAIVMAAVGAARLLRPAPALAGAAAIAAALGVTAATRAPDWGRIPFAEAYTVSMPPVPDGSLVVLVGQPLGYIAASMPGRDLRFVGLVAWFRDGLLGEAVDRALDAAEGRSWALMRQGEGSTALLAQAGWRPVAARCGPVVTAIDPAGLVLCPLERLPPLG